MNNLLTSQSTIAGSLWPEKAANRWLRAIILAVLGTALLWLSAKVKLDVGPIPITLQSLVILGLGAAYGWRLGAATLMLYLAQGAAGLPVFAGGMGGIGRIIGPTGGYLIGYLPAVFIIGCISEKARGRIAWDIIGMLAGTIVLYACGVTWLKTLTGMPWPKTLAVGMFPFLVGDNFKLAKDSGITAVATQLRPESKGNFTTRAPISPALIGLQFASTTCRFQPGAGLVGDPSLIEY